MDDLTSRGSLVSFRIFVLAVTQGDFGGEGVKGRRSLVGSGDRIGICTRYEVL